MSITLTKTHEDSDSIFIYIPNALPLHTTNDISTWLETLQYIPGKTKNGTAISREQVWFQEEGKYFCDKWKYKYDRWKSRDYSSVLKQTQDKIEKITESRLGKPPNFNSCLVNLYRNGMNKITPHRDSAESFGRYPTIANFSIGASRTIRVKNKNEYIDFVLGHNSLFIMAGGSQEHFVHELLEDSSVKNIRYSLTFRNQIL